jgi:V/A-type H+-transporting ATPase subunit D
MATVVEVKPTRMELIEVRKKIRLSEIGYNLLRMKRDGLIIEFFNVLSRARDVRTKIVDDYRIAEEKMAIARCTEGSAVLEAAAFSIENDPKVKVDTKNVMGVLVPMVESATVRRRIDNRGFGLVGISARIDEVIDAYETLVEDIIIAAELETTLRKLLDEIERTKRRVNALEYRVIPTLKEIESFIRLRLEELERENIFRLKRIKGQ